MGCSDKLIGSKLGRVVTHFKSVWQQLNQVQHIPVDSAKEWNIWLIQVKLGKSNKLSVFECMSY